MNRDILKRSTILTLLLVVGSCYNNSHVRTQRVLEEGESVLSVGSNFVIQWGDDGSSSSRIDEHGVSGSRIGLSYLKNINDTEHGIYLGMGLLDGPSSYILGHDYRKVVNDNGQQFRYSLYSEYNLINETDAEEWGPDISGSAVQLRPAISTITSESNKYYAGVHGILGFGTISESYYDYQSGRVDYSYNTSVVGAGISAGYEQRVVGWIVQSHFDLSLLNRTSDLMDGFSGIDDTYGLEPLDATNVHFGFGVAIYGAPNNKPGASRVSQKPPPQYMVEKNQTSELAYDPFTGKMVEKEQESQPLQFDPETGELTEVSASDPQFDPSTGELIVEAPPMEFDPITGLPVEEKAPAKSPEESLLSVEEMTQLIFKGLRIVALNGVKVNAEVLDLNDYGIVIRYKGTGTLPRETLNYQQINQIQFGTPSGDLAKAGTMALGGCASGVGIPIALALFTGEWVYMIASVYAAPVAGVGGFLLGLSHQDQYTLNFTPYAQIKLSSEEIQRKKKQAILSMTKHYLNSGFPSYDLVP